MRSPLALAAAAATLVVVGGSAASAFWTTTGAGDGVAANDTMTFDAMAATGETPASTLVPGGTAELVVKVNNPNGFSVVVTDVAAAGAVVAANGCSTTGIALDPSGIDYSATQLQLDAGETAVLRLPAAATMALAADNACQGTTFDVPVTVTVTR